MTGMIFAKELVLSKGFLWIRFWSIFFLTTWSSRHDLPIFVGLWFFIDVHLFSSSLLRECIVGFPYSETKAIDMPRASLTNQ
jgi:hypothetical protein